MEPELEIAARDLGADAVDRLPFTMTAIVPFLTAARTEFTSVAPVLTRLLFAVVSHTWDPLLLAAIPEPAWKDHRSIGIFPQSPGPPGARRQVPAGPHDTTLPGYRWLS